MNIHFGHRVGKYDHSLRAQKGAKIRGDGAATITFKPFSRRKSVAKWRNTGVLLMKQQ